MHKLSKRRSADDEARREAKRQLQIEEQHLLILTNSQRRRRFTDPELAKAMLAKHFTTDVCSTTLEQLVADRAERLERPHAIAKTICNLADALGFRAGSAERANLCHEFASAAAQKYWRVLWSPRLQFAARAMLGWLPKFLGVEDSNLSFANVLDALMCKEEEQVPEFLLPSDAVAVLNVSRAMYVPSLAHYSHNRFFSQVGNPNIETDPAVAVQMLSRHHVHSAHKLASCIDGDLLKTRPIAEVLLARRSAHHTNPMDFIGDLATDEEFIRSMVKHNVRLLKYERCGLSADKDFVLSLMDTQSPDTCCTIYRACDSALRKDGTFTSEAIGKCLKVYGELKPLYKSNPLYALAYLVKGRVHLNFAHEIYTSKALANSEDFARMLLFEQADDTLISYGPYHVYSLFSEEIRMKPSIAALAFKACNGVKRERDNMLYTLHFTLYGNAEFLAKVRVKDGDGWLEEAVRECARAYGYKKSKRQPALNVYNYQCDPMVCRTPTELQWLEKHRPQLLQEAKGGPAAAVEGE
jgi:hypothetical protein